MKKCLKKRLFIALIFSIITINLLAQTFVEQTGISLPGVSNGSVVCGDYDNDGDLDVLLVSRSISKIYQNQGNFVFLEQQSTSFDGRYNGKCLWSDYDNDGDLDILMTGSIEYFGAPTTIIYQNQGNNNFSPQDDIYLNGIREGTVDWGDYNDDGFLDILLIGSSTYIYKNNGDNTFSQQNNSNLKSVAKGFGIWGDLNNDGNLDIIIAGDNFGSYITEVYYNNGDNTFSEATGLGLKGVYLINFLMDKYFANRKIVVE